jgi:hypothetical protein
MLMMVRPLQSVHAQPAAHSDPVGAQGIEASNPPCPELDPTVLARIFACLPPNEVVLSVRCLDKHQHEENRQQHTVHGAGGPIPLWALQRQWSLYIQQECCSNVGPASRPSSAGAVHLHHASTLPPPPCCALNLKHLTEVDTKFMLLAICTGSLDGIQWLHKELDCQLPKDLVTLAAKCGQLGVLRWGVEEAGCILNKWTALHAAAQGAHAHVFDWLCDKAGETLQVVRRCSSIAAAAASSGSLSMLQAVLGSGFPVDEEACAAAAEAGQMTCLQWLREVQGCPWDSEVTKRAARGGHKEVLQYAIQHGCPYNKEACIAAARGGHLSCLRLLREQNGCPWDKEVVQQAARGGSLECVVYAVEHGCPWHDDACASAAAKGHWRILEWALQHGHSFDEKYMCELACRYGRLSTLQWAVGEGLMWDAHICYLAAMYYAHVQEWIRQQVTDIEWP